MQDRAYIDALNGLDLAEIVITSQATLIEGPAPGGAFQLDGVDAVAVVPKLAEGKKCQRCWKILPDVAGEGPYVDLEPRCADAVAFTEQSA